MYRTYRPTTTERFRSVLVESMLRLIGFRIAWALIEPYFLSILIALAIAIAVSWWFWRSDRYWR